MKEFNDFVSTSSKCQDKAQIANNKLSAIHGGAFIDLNMDCKPDLLIEATDAAGNRIVETYFTEKDTESFCLVSSDTFADKAVAANTSSFSFQDLLRLGSNHALALDNSNQLHVMINRYNLPNPTDTSETLCVWKEQLGTNQKHLPPFDGIKNFGTAFTDVRFFFKISHFLTFARITTITP